MNFLKKYLKILFIYQNKSCYWNLLRNGEIFLKIIPKLWLFGENDATEYL